MMKYLPVFNPDLPWTEHIVEVGVDCEQESKPVVHGGVLHVQPILSIDADLKDGWVAEDRSGELYWYYEKPNRCKYEWIPTEEFGNYTPLPSDEVIFPSSWNWDQRIVRIVDNQIVRDE